MQCDTIDDLEDIGSNIFQDDSPRVKASRDKTLRKQKRQGKAKEAESPPVIVNSSAVPGTEKIYLKTFGCSHNVSDGQFMAGLLAEQGYRMVHNTEEADLVLINSCTVVNPSQQAFLSLMNKAHKIGKPVVVAGCVPQGQASLSQLNGVSIIGITQIDRVVEVVEETLKGNTVQLLAKKALPSLDLPKIRKNPDIEIIPINSGCLGACTYCKTVFARGKLISYAPEAIVSKMRSAITEGVKEIWLTSEDTGAYGIDRQSSIAELLVAITEELERHPGVMMRIGMSNPPYMLAHLRTIADFLNHPRVYAFAHIPVQAGSDTVLAKMNREYSVRDFQTVADYLIKHVPGITIATDIICGFAEETEEEFEQTLRLIDRYRFRVVNINQFYLRPGTPAASLQQLPSSVVKARSQKLTELFHSYQHHSYLAGQEQRVWLNEMDTYKGVKCLVGHTKNYTKIVFPYDARLQYKQVMVRVDNTYDWHVEGVIIDANPPPLIIPSDYVPNMRKEMEAEKEGVRTRKALRMNQLNQNRLKMRLAREKEGGNKENQSPKPISTEVKSCCGSQCSCQGGCSEGGCSKKVTELPEITQTSNQPSIAQIKAIKPPQQSSAVSPACSSQLKTNLYLFIAIVLLILGVISTAL